MIDPRDPNKAVTISSSKADKIRQAYLAKVEKEAEAAKKLIEAEKYLLKSEREEKRASKKMRKKQVLKRIRRKKARQSRK